MATQVKIDLRLQDPSASINKRTSEIKSLNKELTKAQQLATGTKTGSRAVSATYSAASENISYGQARGSMGATGASGRDFANQAQGLGGLVRLYATYAANLFAVSAGFNALSQAMNTANMIQGLDQLGAVGGKALGTLSKQFTEASGGAISLRESMEAVVKASSSGLSNQQILQIGEVAKKASQALGISMTDAVSRLTRGITKLEPELLDELAIFTKLGTATEAYARKVGKTEASLTQFERQQAFANAVLAEGIEKFSSINIPTNPYDKLLASLKNIGFETLNLINKGLAPLIELLSKNPAVLAVGLAMFAASIVRKVIPALGEYREQLAQSAQAAKTFYDKQAIAAKNASDIALKSKEAQKKIKLESLENQWYVAMESAEKRVAAAKTGPLSERVSKIMAKDTLDVSKREIEYLNLLGKRDAIYANLANSIQGAQKVNQKLLDSEKQLNAEIGKRPSLFSMAGVAQARAESARRSAASKAIVSEAGATAAEQGFSAATVGAFNNLKTAKLGIIRTSFTGIAVAANLAAVGIGAAFTVLSRMMGVVGLLYGVYELLNATLSGNAKQMDAFNSAVSEVADSTKLAADVTKLYGDTISVNSIIAKANAFETLASSVKNLTKTLEDAVDTSTGFDKFIDGFLTVIDKDLKSKFATSLGLAVKNGIDQIADPELRKQAEDQIKELLKVSDTSVNSIRKATKALPNEEVLKTGEKVGNVLLKTSEAAKKNAIPLTAVKDGFKSLDKSFTDLGNTLIDRNPLTIFALDLATQSNNMVNAFGSVINKAAILNEILKDTSTVKSFPAAAQQDLLAAADAQRELNDLIRNRQELQRQETVTSLTAEATKGTAFGEQQKSLSASYASAGKALDEQINITRNSIESRFISGLAKGGQESVRLIESGLTRAYAKAAIDTQKTLLGSLPKTTATIELQTQLELQSINLRKEELSTTRNLINTIDRDRISRELSAVKAEIAKAPSPMDVAPELFIKERSLLQQEKAYAGPKELKAGGEPLTPEALTILSRQTGYLSQLAGLDAQAKSAIINGIVATVTAAFEQTRKLQERELADLGQKNKEFFESPEFRALPEATQAEQRFTKQQQEETKKSRIAGLGPEQAMATAAVVENEALRLKSRGGASIAQAAQQAAKTSQDELLSMESIETRARSVAKSTFDRVQATEATLRLLEKSSFELDNQNKLQAIIQDNESNIIETEKQRIQVEAERGIITEDSYRQQSVALEQLSRKRNFDNKLALLQLNHHSSMVALTKEYTQALSEGKETTNIVERMDARNAEYDAQVEGTRRVYAEIERTKSLTDSLSSRQLAYEDVFKNSFVNMGDAILEFVKTGKLSFESLITSMVEGLLRYELQLQTTAMYEAFRPGIGSFLSSILIPSNASTTIPMQAGGGYAKGGAFDSGIQAFAKGGMFTNSVVSSPTLFKFAQGTGLMGEAGPEAIMPLKRDSNGNLGVRGGSNGGNTEVIVNNYTTEKAETKETTDSRGNRKIEVIVGDITAGELARSGSASQKAVGSTFGLRPQLIRR